MTAIGDLRERVTVQRATLADDGAGGHVRSWAPIATRWAQVLPTGGKEQLTSGGLQGVQGWRVTLRKGVGIRPEDRIVWGEVTMNVRSAADPRGDGFFDVVFAEAGVVTE